MLKVYSEFSISSKRVEKLKDFCEFTNTTYRDILRHVTTRWLSLLPAIQRILECWPALKSYFVSLGKEDCSNVIWKFFMDCQEGENIEHTVGECIVVFMHNIMQEFNKCIMTLESDATTVIDAYSIMTHLRNQLYCRRKDQFYGMNAKQMIRTFTTPNQKLFHDMAASFFSKALQYLEERFDYGNSSFGNINSLKLDGKSIDWSELETLPRKLGINVDENKLYLDVITLNAVLEKIPRELSVDKKWAYFFKRETACTELLKVVSFILSLPASNAYTERVFSMMQDVWSKNRNRLGVSIVKAELQVKLNFNLSCSEFTSFVESNKKLILAAKSTSKYRWSRT